MCVSFISLIKNNILYINKTFFMNLPNTGSYQIKKACLYQY